MSSLKQQVLDLNPWWVESRLINKDTSIIALKQADYKWIPPAQDELEKSLLPNPEGVDALSLLENLTEEGLEDWIKREEEAAKEETDSFWVPRAQKESPANSSKGQVKPVVLLGPRFSGKTTIVKSLIKKLLKKGERRVLYFDFDYINDPDAIREVLVNARKLHPEPVGQWFFFLDNVTGVPEWEEGIKAAMSAGIRGGDRVVVTGANAAEVWREDETSIETEEIIKHFPMSFRDFCVQIKELDLPDISLSVPELLKPDGEVLAKTLYLQVVGLERALRDYSNVGGYPAAISDYVSSGTVAPTTVDGLWNSITKELSRSGKDPIRARKLLEHVRVSVGSTFKWTDAAEAMGVGSHNTAKDYVKTLTDMFVVFPVRSWNKKAGKLEARRQRKLYFTDPLLEHISDRSRLGNSIADALEAIPVERLEGLMGSSFYRIENRERDYLESMVRELGYWTSSSKREVDFVLPTGNGARFAVEVKGDDEDSGRASRLALKNGFGKGIVATSTRFEFDEKVPLVPVSVILAAVAKQNVAGSRAADAREKMGEREMAAARALGGVL